MKDLTHYFQAPKAKSNSSEVTAIKTASKCKRKASESVDSEGAKSLYNNKTTSEEEIFKSKKPRKSASSLKKKSTKPTVNSVFSENISDDENIPILKRTVQCNSDSADKNHSTENKKVRVFMKKKTPDLSELEKDRSLDGINFNVQVVLSDCLKASSSVANTNTLLETDASDLDSCFVIEKKAKRSFKSKNDIGCLKASSSVTKTSRSLENEVLDLKSCLLVEKKSKKSSKSKDYSDCLKTNTPIVKTNGLSRTEVSDLNLCSLAEKKPKESSNLKNESHCSKPNSSIEKTDGLLETGITDLDSCIVTEKKPKKVSKSKNDKEEESNKNNLLNYFAKVDKIQSVHDINRSNIITVQAIVHSPPKDKSKLIKERDPNVFDASPVLFKNSKKKKCNFDDITVIEEIIKVDEGSSKVSEFVPTTPQPQIEDVSLESTASRGKSWKMRVKLTPSAKLEAVIAKSSSSKKYKKIVFSPNSSDEEDIENKIDTQSDTSDVEFVSISKKDSALPENTEKSQPIKLAPLFTKRNDTKNTSNRIRISEEAKRQFLESGVPDVIKKKMEEQKNIVEDEYRGEYVFPKCNHIQQKEPKSFVWNLEECYDFKLRESEDVQIEEILHQSYCSLITNEVRPQFDQGNEEKFEFNLKDEINSLKKQEPNVNVMDIHSSIKRLKKVSESVHDICWTEKYKPFVFGDMIGNTNSLYQLKEWIESHKRIKQVFLESDSSSGGEFVDSDDSCCSTEVKNNVAIVVGPPGCGKTCAVYMLANELGFKVLEVNAGSNRAGKKIIDELLEATQSHRVKRTFGSLPSSKPGKSPKKKKGRESKKDKKTMSLILIEDADILFENYDEGFLSALNSLTSLSKRPLIFTVNNLNYPHLHKYNNAQNLILRFHYPPRASINSWLRLIALLEGVQLSDEVLIELYKIAGSDLRKNLLQLQMLVQSKYQYPKSSNEQLFYQDWLSNVRCLGDKKITPKLNECNGASPHDKLFSDDETPSLDNFKKPLSKDDAVVKPKSKSEMRHDREELLESVKFLNYAANLDNFAGGNNQDQKIFLARFYPDTDENDFTHRLNCDLVEFIKNKIFNKYEKNTLFSFKKYYNAVSQHSRINTISENVFISFNPRISNQQARNCDYLPVIRDIARFEKNKTPSTSRRSNRYFTYLKSVSVDITDKEIEILCNTFVS